MHLPPSFARFLVSGGVNTLITYVLYLALLQVLPYRLSYTISFVFGIALAYVINHYFVFQVRRHGARGLLFPFVYAVQYLVGLLVVHTWVALLHWHASLAPLAAIVVTLPVTFLLSKWVFEGGPRT